MGSEAKEAPGVIAQIDALREELLAYDAAADKGGARWDDLKIALDRKILGVRVQVETVVATWEAEREGSFDGPGLGRDLFEALEALRPSKVGSPVSVRPGVPVLYPNVPRVYVSGDRPDFERGPRRG